MAESRQSVRKEVRYCYHSGRRRRALCCPVLVLLVLAAVIGAACQNGPQREDGQGEPELHPETAEEIIRKESRPLADPDDPDVAAANADAIGILEHAFGVLERYATSAMGETDRTRFRRLIQALQEAVAQGRVRVAQLPAGGWGFTWRDIVVLNEALLGGIDRDLIWETGALIDLLDVVVHEAVHLADPAEQPAPSTDATPEQVLAWKLERLGRELPAYRQDLLFKSELVTALVQIRHNRLVGRPLMQGVPAFAKPWSELGGQGLDRLIARAEFWVQGKRRKLEGLRSFIGADGQPLSLDGVRDRWEKEVGERFGIPFDPQTAAQQIDTATVFNFLWLEVAGVQHSFWLDWRTPSLETPDSLHRGDGPFDCGIPHPLDATLWMHKGRPHLVVLGLAGPDLRDPTAVVRIFPALAPDAPQAGFVASPVAALRTKRLLTSVTREPGGGLLVLDGERVQIHRLEDTDGDRMPDRVSERSLRIGPLPPGAHHVADLGFLGHQLIGRLRVTEPLGRPILLFRQDPDGSFRAVAFE